jgi:adenylate kinase
VAQAEALDKKKSTQVKSAIFFEIPKSELVSRLTGRRTCVNCGESYHIVFSPPKKENHCDKCGGTLIHRPDDNENVVERRLEVFDEQNGSLLSYYKSKNNLKKLHANQPIHYVENELAKLLS